MAIGSGLATQFGIKTETTWGTPVTVDQFTNINSESIKAEVGKIESPYLGNLVMGTSQVSTYVSGAGGGINFPFFNKGMGTLLKHCFGSVVSAQVASTAEYTHTFTLDLAAGKFGLGATVQVGRPDVTGTVRPFTYEGGKVVAFTINMDAQGLLTLDTTWAFEDEETGTALASPSYLTNRSMFNWSGATLSWGGSATFVRNFSLTCEFAYDLDRRGLSQTLRKEPIANGMVGITGSMEGEFASLAAYNDFVAGTQRELIFTAEGADIPTTSNPYKVAITLDAAELTGDTPNVGGPEILTQPMPFRALYDGSTAPVTLVYHNDETTVS